MSTTRIVATDATRSLPVPNSRTFPMTGAVRSVARQRKVSVASRKKISIRKDALRGVFFMMAVTVPCRHGVKDTRYAGVFFYGQASCMPGSHHNSPVQCRWPLPPDVGLTEGYRRAGETASLPCAGDRSMVLLSASAKHLLPSGIRCPARAGR